MDGRQHLSLVARPECPILVPLDSSPFAEHALEVAETLALTVDLSLVLAGAIALKTCPERSLRTSAWRRITCNVCATPWSGAVCAAQ